MADHHNIESDKRARLYLRSTLFRICSWSSAAFLAAAFLIPSHRIWLIYAAGAVAFGGMLPVLRVVPYSRTLNIHNRRDKQFLVFVSMYVALILIVACLLVHFSAHR